MTEHTITIVLRLLHVVSGALWAGAAIFLALFMVPTVRALGPDGGKVMQELMIRRKLPIYMMILAIIAIVSGTLMFWRFDAATGHAFSSSTPGRVFALGGGLAFIALLVGMFVNRPTSARVQQLGAAMAHGGGPPSAEQRDEMGRLQGKLMRATQVVAWLVLGAVACMAVARYT